MRIFVKMILIVATATAMIFCYKFVIVNGGVKTALNYSNLSFNDYGFEKRQEILGDVQKIYAYRAFGRNFYIFETGENGLLLESIGLDESPAQAFVHQGLARVLEETGAEEIKVPHWAIFAGIALVIVLFPSFKKKRKKT